MIKLNEIEERISKFQYRAEDFHKLLSLVKEWELALRSIMSNGDQESVVIAEAALERIDESKL
jgi:hypothetical protein